MASLILRTGLGLLCLLGIHLSWYLVLGATLSRFEIGSHESQLFRPHHRIKRQDENCSSTEYTCKDGECIYLDFICDGEYDCTDESDDTEETCKSFECPDYLFRCKYGACVDADVRCDGDDDCVDGSDEETEMCEKIKATTMLSDDDSIESTPAPDDVSPSSENPVPDKPIETTPAPVQIASTSPLLPPSASPPETSSEATRNDVEEDERSNLNVQQVFQFIKDNQDKINFSIQTESPIPLESPSTVRPGHVTWLETLGIRNPILNQIPALGRPATHSVPDVHYAFPSGYANVPQLAAGERPASNATQDIRRSMCVLPSYPMNGYYFAISSGFPGEIQYFAELTHSCDEGYSLVGKGRNQCLNGLWDLNHPVCERQCRPLLTQQAECFDVHSETQNRCDTPQNSMTKASIRCRSMMGFRVHETNLTCINGIWDNDIPACASDLGARDPAAGDPDVGDTAVRNTLAEDFGEQKGKIHSGRKNYTLSYVDGNVHLTITAIH